MTWRLLAAILLASGAAMAQQSALQPAGPRAHAIALLWWVFFGLLTAIFLIVIGIMSTAILRRHGGSEQEELEHNHRPPAATEHKLATRVSIASSLTILILLGLIVVSVATGNVISRPRAAISIDIIGNQWWWFVRYNNADASRILTSANEIHIPTGRSVELRLSSQDVIHSFWVPGLNGKRDLIPSRVNTQWIQADQPGKYRGQCAEFCGLGHANMAMWVVAEPPDQFENWYNAQLAPAHAPSNPAEQQGQKIFLDHACAMCHSIEGTAANGQVGPDLTHFGSRLTIAAGTVPNSKGRLGGWIADPENVKPGNHMATIPLRPDEMDPLLDYLESLK